MLAVIGDTHGETDHRLDGRVREAVRAADHVCHTGDFTTGAVHDALADEAGTETGGAPLTAVHGNSDEPELRSRLPETATLEVGPFVLVVAHGHRRDGTGLSLLAREAGADLVVVGHTHTPAVERTPVGLVVNPGSYADPRGSRPAYAEIRCRGQSLAVSVRTPAGDPLAEQTVQK